jgi:DNA polymerase-1
MVLQVHDELVFEAPEGEVDRLMAMVREVMETVVELRVPLKVDIGAGANWAAAKG